MLQMIAAIGPLSKFESLYHHGDQNCTFFFVWHRRNDRFYDLFETLLVEKEAAWIQRWDEGKWALGIVTCIVGGQITSLVVGNVEELFHFYECLD